MTPLKSAAMVGISRVHGIFCSMPSRFLSFQTAVFFANFAPHSNAAKLWGELFEEPYSQHQNPIPPLSVAMGSEGGFAFELQHQQGRIDLIVRPEDNEPGPPKSVSSLDILTAPALQRLPKILEGLTVTRIAAITNTTAVARDQQHASVLFRDAVPGFPDISDVTDMVLQLNKRRPSTVQDGLYINRLCRWTVVLGNSILFQVVNGVPTPLPSGEAQWSVDTLIDINTVPEIRPAPDRVMALFGELVTESAAIAAQGFTRLV